MISTVEELILIIILGTKKYNAGNSISLELFE